ncbi:MAG: type II toxin-antitoxin system VapC family toxin [Terracidiphilus sp.]
MKYLLDTHFVLWIPIDDPSMGRTARAILSNSSNEFVFSAASLWEIAIKRSLARGNFAADPSLIRRQMIDHGYEELPVTGEHAAAVEVLPPIHKDPFDRILIAQAQIEGISLLTRDATIARYPGPIRKV